MKSFNKISELSKELIAALESGLIEYKELGGNVTLLQTRKDGLERSINELKNEYVIAQAKYDEVAETTKGRVKKANDEIADKTLKFTEMTQKAYKDINAKRQELQDIELRLDSRENNIKEDEVAVSKHKTQLEALQGEIHQAQDDIKDKNKQIDQKVTELGVKERDLTVRELEVNKAGKAIKEDRASISPTIKVIKEKSTALESATFQLSDNMDKLKIWENQLKVREENLLRRNKALSVKENNLIKRETMFEDRQSTYKKHSELL
jgi:predicted  nucleic acid-binding Zn-ribbon protein